MYVSTGATHWPSSKTPDSSYQNLDCRSWLVIYLNRFSQCCAKAKTSTHFSPFGWDWRPLSSTFLTHRRLSFVTIIPIQIEQDKKAKCMAHDTHDVNLETLKLTPGICSSSCFDESLKPWDLMRKAFVCNNFSVLMRCWLRSFCSQLTWLACNELAQFMFSKSLSTSPHKELNLKTSCTTLKCADKGI